MQSGYELFATVGAIDQTVGVGPKWFAGAMRTSFFMAARLYRPDSMTRFEAPFFR